MTTTVCIVAACLIVSLLLGLLITPNILLISHKKRLYDIPNERKLHTVLVPQLGGAAFFLTIVTSMCFVLGICVRLDMLPVDPLYGDVTAELLFLVVGSMLLYLIGIADDLVGVRYIYKFAVQFVAALLLVGSGCWFNHLGGFFGIGSLSPWVGIPFTIVFVVYTINALNLIDGIDGLASGLSSISLVVLGSMFFLLHHDIHAALAAATLGVLVPFWFFNVFGNARKGHKLFMGDSGSLVLGFILAYLVLRLSIAVPAGHYHPRQLVMSVTPLLIPLLDVIRVVFFRLRHGHHPFLPDKNHFHHKLLRTGMSPTVVMVFILFVCLFFVAFNYVMTTYMMPSHVTPIFLLDITLWLLMHAVINYFVHRHLGTKTT